MKSRFALILLAAFALEALFISPARAQDQLFLFATEWDGTNNLDRAIPHFDTTTGEFLGYFTTRSSCGLSDYFWGATFGPDGNLYVADFINGFIAVFDGTTGAFLRYFSTGLGSYSALYMTFGQDGYLYISAGGVNRLNGTTGEYVDTPVPVGTEGLSEPQGLVFGADGKLYIGDYGSNSVLRYDPKSGVTETFVPSGYGDLSGPRQLTFGPDGNLYVASEYTGSIKRYSGVTGEYLGDFGDLGGHLTTTLSVAFSPDGKYMYADWTWADPNVPLSDLTPWYGGVARFDGHTGAFIDYFIRGFSTENLLFNTGRTQVSQRDTSGNLLPVAVSPLPTATLTFSDITSAGQTAVTPLDSATTSLPANFQVATQTAGFPTYFDITTTAGFSGSVTLGIGYDPTQFRSDQNPSGPDPQLLHYTNGAWGNVTTSVDTVNHKVYGSTTSFSPFAIVRHAPYAWSGVLQPINSDGSSIFKKGSTVPVKFKLMGADAANTTLNAKLYIAQTSSVDPVEANEADSTAAADTGNTFRYSGGQYIFNLSTKDLTQGTWYLRIDMGDGASNIVQIKLKK
jgi:hypothetical protein